MARKKTKRLRYEDRVIIERMSKAGKKVADIANEIGVHRDTIYKEFTRCGATKETYSAGAGPGDKTELETVPG